MPYKICKGGIEIMEFKVKSRKLKLENTDVIYAKVYKEITNIFSNAEKKYKIAFEKEIKKLGVLKGITCASLINNPNVDVAILHQIEIDRNLGKDLEELDGLEYELQEQIDKLIEKCKKYVNFYDDEIEVFTWGAEFGQISQYYSMPKEIEDMWGEEAIRKRLKWRYDFWANKEMRKKRYLNMHDTIEKVTFDFMEELDRCTHLGYRNRYNRDSFTKCLAIVDKLDKKGEASIDELIENIKRFPFVKSPYVQFIRFQGDEDKELDKYAEFIGIPLAEMKISLLKEFCNTFANVNFENEESVKDVYEKICTQKKYVGVDKELELENKLRKSLECFGVQRRTVNGILYDTEEKAQEVQKRSFEGIEYVTIEEAREAGNEVNRIRQIVGDANGKERYEKLLFLNQYIWRTLSAKKELVNLEKVVDKEYMEIEENAKNKSRKLGKVIFTAIIFWFSCFILGGFLYTSNIWYIMAGMGLAVYSFSIWLSKLRNLKKCTEAEKILKDWVMDIEKDIYKISIKQNVKPG